MSNLQAALRAQTTIMAERMRIVERAVAATAAASSSGSGERRTLLADVIGDVDDQQAVAAIVGSVNEQLCQSTDSIVSPPSFAFTTTKRIICVIPTRGITNRL
jgi:hypothetical protein